MTNLTIVVAFSLKLLSFIQINRKIKAALPNNFESGKMFLDPLSIEFLKANPKDYLEKLTYFDFIYFIMVPTLTYKIIYKRLPHIRIRYLFKYLFVMTVYLILCMYTAFEPWQEAITESSSVFSFPFSFLRFCVHVS